MKLMGQFHHCFMRFVRSNITAVFAVNKTQCGHIFIPPGDESRVVKPGGQQQRVFLARALAQESDLYFMDEPFAGVDAATEAAIVTILQELKDQGKTLLVVHHDLPTAKTYFDSLLLLNMRVVAFGPTEEVFNYDLLQSTYGGRLTILSEVADAVGAKAR